MKNSIVPAIVCCLIFVAYVAGQNQANQKPVEPCCCHHLQQMADDLHWIRERLSKPFVAPPEINTPKIEKPNFNFPKAPSKR